MITAVFQLLSQIIKLSYFPQIKVVHTSNIFHGQIYIPWINWLLMIGTIVVTAAYSNVSLAYPLDDFETISVDFHEANVENRPPGWARLMACASFL